MFEREYGLYLYIYYKLRKMKSTLYAISSKAERVNITEVILHNEELY